MTPGQLRTDPICGHGATVDLEARLEDGRLTPEAAHVGQLGTGLHGHPKAVTLVVGRAERVEMLADEAGDDGRVPLEPATGEDHALAGTDETGAGGDAGDRPVEHDQLVRRRAHEHLDAAVEQALEQRSHQGRAEHPHVVALPAAGELHIRQPRRPGGTWRPPPW